MNKRLRWIIAFLLICGVSTYVKSVVNASVLEKGFPTAVSRSLEESQVDGVFVSKVDVFQSSGGSGAVRFKVIEAWIEKESVLEFPFIWFERRVSKEGFRLVIITDSIGFDRSFLHLPDSKAGFTRVGPNMNHIHLHEIPKESFDILLSEGWNRPPTEIFSISIKET